MECGAGDAVMSPLPDVAPLIALWSAPRNDDRSWCENSNCGAPSRHRKPSPVSQSSLHFVYPFR